MLQTITTPNAGHPVTYHFAEGASTWGHLLSPSIVHLIQSARTFTIGYSRIGAGVIFQSVSGMATGAHVVDGESIGFDADAATFRQAVGTSRAGTHAIVHCRVGDDCELKLWGTVRSVDRAHQDAAQTHTVGVIFIVAFWEISRSPGNDLAAALRAIEERDGKLRELEAKVALTMCSQ